MQLHPDLVGANKLRGPYRKKKLNAGLPSSSRMMRSVRRMVDMLRDKPTNKPARELYRKSAERTKTEGYFYRLAQRMESRGLLHYLVVESAQTNMRPNSKASLIYKYIGVILRSMVGLGHLTPAILKNGLDTGEIPAPVPWMLQYHTIPKLPKNYRQPAKISRHYNAGRSTNLQMLQESSRRRNRPRSIPVVVVGGKEYRLKDLTPKQLELWGDRRPPPDPDEFERAG